MKIHFTTIFDSNYLSRGLALYDSIKKHHEHFVLYIVCLDEKVWKYFTESKLKNIELIRLAEIEEYYPELIEVKGRRGKVDYIFTLSPYYPSFILEKYGGIPFICSLDSDQYFFSSSEPLFNELNSCSILIMPHRFPVSLKHKEVYGKYNVSFQVFKNDVYGKQCLKIWRDQCFNWCEDKLEQNRFADQKYLDFWPEMFGNKLKEIDNPGIGLAPWNIANCTILLENKTVKVNGNNLVLYHYQGLRFITNKLVMSGLSHYDVKPSTILTNFVLKPIIVRLSKNETLKDKISRGAVINDNKFINKINENGMFYIFQGLPIGMDLIFKLNKKRNRFNGILNRLKNVYRPAR